MPPSLPRFGATEATEILIVLAGRPGTGKTTVARGLAAERQAAHVRVDAVEASFGCYRTGVPASAFGREK